MPDRVIRELREHEKEVFAAVVDVLTKQAGGMEGLMSDPDTNIARMAILAVRTAEPLIAALTLRAFAEGAGRSLGEMPPAARLGATTVLAAARDVADGIERGWS